MRSFYIFLLLFDNEIGIEIHWFPARHSKLSIRAQAVYPVTLTPSVLMTVSLAVT